MSYEPSEEKFLKDVAAHKMTVLRDDGLYRHLRFSSGSFNQQFDLVTWPGSLCYTGDMGTWVFERIEDMFKFFRGNGINPPYWAEKVEAQDRTIGTQVFSQEQFKAQVLKRLEAWDLEQTNLVNVISELNDEVFCHDNGIEAMSALYHFKSSCGRVQFDYEFPDGKIYTRRYIWCCRAIAWGIAQYDKAKEAERG